MVWIKTPVFKFFMLDLSFFRLHANKSSMRLIHLLLSYRAGCSTMQVHTQNLKFAFHRSLSWNYEEVLTLAIKQYKEILLLSCDSVLLPLIVEHYHFDFTVSVQFATSNSRNHWAILNKNERAYPLVYLHLCFCSFSDAISPKIRLTTPFWQVEVSVLKAPFDRFSTQNISLHCFPKYLKNSSGNLQARSS